MVAVETRALGYELIAEIEPRVDLDSAEASAAFANLIAHLHREKKRQSLSELFLFVSVSCVPQPPWTASEEATCKRAMACSCALFASLSTSVLQVPTHLLHALPAPPHLPAPPAPTHALPAPPRTYQPPRTYSTPYPRPTPPPAPTPRPTPTLYPLGLRDISSVTYELRTTRPARRLTRASTALRARSPSAGLVLGTRGLGDAHEWLCSELLAQSGV